MNKKIKLSLMMLLSIGSISITSLPLVSCNNSETTVVPPPLPLPPPTLDQMTELEKEARNLRNQNSKLTKMMATEAQDEIEWAYSIAAKTRVFHKYYTEEVLRPNFSYNYLSSRVDPVDASTWYVTVRVNNTQNGAVLDKEVIINGFAKSSVQLEANKFVDIDSKIINVTSMTAKSDILKSESMILREAALARYYEIKLESGFTYSLKSATAEDTILIVDFTITQINGGKTINKTINITGFIANTGLHIESTKYVDKSAPIFQRRKQATIVAASINAAANGNPKKTEFDKYYTSPGLSSEYTYEVTRAFVDPNDNTQLIVVGAIYHSTSLVDFAEWVVMISRFTAPGA